jgi:hypothetical protein
VCGVFPGCSVRSGSQSSAMFGKDTQESTVSEGTVETMMTMSPSEPQLDPLCKHLLAQRVTCKQVTNPLATIYTTYLSFVCFFGGGEHDSPHIGSGPPHTRGF